MNKLRAIEYFVCAAQAGSLSAAAREFEVSVAAVSKLIASLERELGTRLFDRGTAGLAVTAAGREYLEACRPALEQIANADLRLSAGRTQAAGTVTLAVQGLLARHCLAPALPKFHARHPQVVLDFQDYTPDSADSEGADLRVSLVWDELPDQVVRVLARTRLVVCASPQYWSRHGQPRRPKDLEQHACLQLRTLRGTLTDHWPFGHGAEREAAVVRGWLQTSNNHRDLLVSSALAGEGILRTVDLTIEDELRSGRLVPVLTDWEPLDSPVVRLMHRPAAVRVARVRAVVEFVTEVLRACEKRCIDLVGPRPAGSPPAWAGPRSYRLASTAVHRRGN